MKFTESKLWISIFLLAIYLTIADLFVDYIISREVDSGLQLMAALVFLVLTYYLMKGIYVLWTKNYVKQSKKKKDD